MTRKVASGTPWEPVAGYSRAVAAGDYVFVSGSTAVVDGEIVHPGDAYGQARQAILNLEQGLRALGCTLRDVVRTRMFVTDIGRFAEYAKAHGEMFGDTLPATSMVEVSRLVDERMLIEIEADAYRPGVGLS
ncbi:MAG: RidA family protein [Mycobacteriales bacterium]